MRSLTGPGGSTWPAAKRGCGLLRSPGLHVPGLVPQKRGCIQPMCHDISPSQHFRQSANSSKEHLDLSPKEVKPDYSIGGSISFMSWKALIKFRLSSFARHVFLSYTEMTPFSNPWNLQFLWKIARAEFPITILPAFRYTQGKTQLQSMTWNK